MDIRGLDKARVLKALYNASKLTAPIAIALGHDRGNLTTEEARALMAMHPPYYDYLYGRVLKVHLGEDVSDLDLRLYDRDNGQGSGESAILDEFTRPGQE